jgi:hypothetical protein
MLNKFLKKNNSMQNILEATEKLVRNEWELEGGEAFLSEEGLLHALSNHVAFMIERRLETLLSTLYRMDVSEAKVNRVLHPTAEEPANVGIARLIIERQKARIFTKEHYKQNTTSDWFDF